VNGHTVTDDNGTAVDPVVDSQIDRFGRVSDYVYESADITANLVEIVVYEDDTQQVALSRTLYDGEGRQSHTLNYTPDGSLIISRSEFYFD